MKLAIAVLVLLLLQASELASEAPVELFIQKCRMLICRSDCEFFNRCIDFVLPCGKKGWALRTGKKACIKLQKYYGTFESVGKEFVEDGLPRIMQALFYKAIPHAADKDCKSYSELCQKVFQDAVSEVGFSWAVWYNRHITNAISGKDPEGIDVSESDQFNLKKIQLERFKNITKILINKNTEF